SFILGGISLLTVIGVGFWLFFSQGNEWMFWSRPPELPPPGNLREESGGVDVVYLATPQEVVEQMLKMAKVTKDDVVYDLGCGDGRIVVTAAKLYGCKAVGIELDKELVKQSKENAKKNNVGKLVTIEETDFFKVDLRNATVVALYLLPRTNVDLIPQ